MSDSPFISDIRRSPSARALVASRLIRSTDVIRPCFGTPLWEKKVFLHYKYIKGQEINLVESERCFSSLNYVTQSVCRVSVNHTQSVNVK